MSNNPVFSSKDGLPFMVREATAADAESLLEGARAVMAERLDYLITQPEEFSTTFEEECDWIQGFADADNSVLLVAVQAGELVGWVSLRGGARLRTRHTARLGITVARNWRERGIGTALLLTVMDWAAKNPVIEKVKLGTVATNCRALNLYRKLGFVEEGRPPREFKKADGTYLDSVEMYRFVVGTGTGIASKKNGS
jgi:RimJ/RimL family protein N-acetyltransferase